MIARTDQMGPPLQRARGPSGSGAAGAGRPKGAVPQSGAGLGQSGEDFPLTPALSPSAGEREERRQSVGGGRLGSLGAYTLLELLAVITIMGIIAALALPTLRGLKPNAKVAATRDLLDAVGRARQLAISQRTTVYMVFVPTNFWTATAAGSWTAQDRPAVTNLCDKQLVGYAYVCLRSVGDQPGASYPRYLSSWKTLPQGAYIPPAKFWPGLILPNTAVGNVRILPFPVTNNIPFPSETTRPAPYVPMPYIAFDATGQLVSGQPGQPELIPVAEGSVTYARDPISKVAVPVVPAGVPLPQVNELPAGNTVDNYSVVWIERLTGRAHVERRLAQ